MTTSEKLRQEEKYKKARNAKYVVFYKPSVIGFLTGGFGQSPQVFKTKKEAERYQKEETDATYSRKLTSQERNQLKSFARKKNKMRDIS